MKIRKYKRANHLKDLLKKEIKMKMNIENFYFYQKFYFLIEFVFFKSNFE